MCVLTCALRTAGLRSLRAVRALRALKLAGAWEPLNRFLKTAMKALKPVTSLAVLVMLSMLFFALLGKQLFGGTGLAEMTRWHFDRPIPAMLTAIAIFAGEWAGVVYEALDADVAPKLMVMSFVCATLLIGHFVVVNRKCTPPSPPILLTPTVTPCPPR